MVKHMAKQARSQGIHNEPGVRREKLCSLDVTVNAVLDMILKPNISTWNPATGHSMAVMVNNLGGLSVLELSVIAEEVLHQLHARGVDVARSLSGTFVTSLDGPGFSVTLMGLDDELLPLLDAPTAAPAWPRRLSSGWKGVVASKKQENSKNISTNHPIHPGPKGTFPDIYFNDLDPELIFFIAAVLTSKVVDIINSIAKTTIEDEPRITKYDTLAGDGDCGETLLNGVRGKIGGSRQCFHFLMVCTGLVSMSKTLASETVDLASVFRQAAFVAENSMGGTSGAIYAIYINAVATFLEGMGERTGPSSDVSVPMCMAKALEEGLEELYKFTLARQGQRTLMDALIPFVNIFSRDRNFQEAFQAAQKGCEGTRTMEASLGRASYVGKDRFVENGGIPDPGALGVISILRGLERAL